MISKKSQAGFTLLEVLAATMLFLMAALLLVPARNGTRAKVSDSAIMSQAQTLIEMKMTEMELKFQDAIDRNGVKAAFGKDSGTFDQPYQTFTWSAELTENPLVIAEDQLTAFLKAFGLSDEESQGQFEQSKLLLTNLNKALKENMAELSVEVKWKFAGKIKNILLVTHLIPKKPKVSFTQKTDVDQSFSP